MGIHRYPRYTLNGMSQPPTDPGLPFPQDPIQPAPVNATAPPPPPMSAPPLVTPFPNTTTDTGMPKSARAAQIIFFVGAGLAILMLIGAILMGATASQLGLLVGGTLPGYFALAVGIGMRANKRVWWILALVVVGFWILGGLGTIGRGDPRGLVQLVLPISALVLLLRPSARAFYAKKQA